ncbi:MAG: tetratricopeptide repeat protein [Candidatus Eisenbacteria bacterium]
MLVPMIAAAILAAAAVYFAYHPSALIWSLSFGADLSPEARILWIGFGGVAFLLPLLLLASRGKDRWLPRIRPGGPPAMVLIGAAAFLVFYLLRSRNHFLGDGWLITTFIEREGVPMETRPGMGTLWIQRLGFLVLRRFGVGVETYLILFACLAGALYVLLLVRWARIAGGAGPAGTPRGSRLLLAAVPLTAGFMQIYFGYVENYPLVHLFLLLYLIEGTHALLSGRHPWTALAFFGLALLSHWGAIVFFPSLFVLLARKKPEGEGRSPLRFLPEATIILFLLLLPPTLAQFRILLPPLPWYRVSTRTPYGILSIEYVRQCLNFALLLVPAASLLFLVSRRRKEPDPAAEGPLRFLRTAALAGIAFALVMRPFLGPRDWDLFSLFAPPVALWAAFRARRRLEGRRILPAGLFAAGIGLFFLAPWVLGNRDPEAGARRVVRMIEEDPNHYRGKRPLASSLAWVMVERDAGEVGFELLQHVIRKRPDDAVAQANLGILYFQRGEYEEARPHLAEALRSAPELSQPIFYLGATEFMLQRTDLGEMAFREYLHRNPGNLSAESYLGRALMWRGEWEEALEHLLVAHEALPNEADLNFWIARTLDELGRREEARAYAGRALAADPNHQGALRLRSKIAGGSSEKR